MDLEQRTSDWLKRIFGFDTKIRDIANGKVATRPYEVDVHGTKKEGFLFIKDQFDVWVECKVPKIKRDDVLNS